MHIHLNILISAKLFLFTYIFFTNQPFHHKHSQFLFPTPKCTHLSYNMTKTCLFQLLLYPMNNTCIILSVWLEVIFPTRLNNSFVFFFKGKQMIGKTMFQLLAGNKLLKTLQYCHSFQFPCRAKLTCKHSESTEA